MSAWSLTPARPCVQGTAREPADAAGPSSGGGGGADVAARMQDLQQRLKVAEEHAAACNARAGEASGFSNGPSQSRPSIHPPLPVRPGGPCKLLLRTIITVPLLNYTPEYLCAAASCAVAA